MRIPYISLLAAGALALGGCAYGNLGVGVGSPYYGSSYGYGSPYYGSYGYSSPYYGSSYSRYGCNSYGSPYYGSRYGSGGPSISISIGSGGGYSYGYGGSPYSGCYDDFYGPRGGYYGYYGRRY